MKTIITALALTLVMAAPALARDEPMPFPEYQDWVTTNLITEGDTGSSCNDPEAEPLVVTEEQLACYSGIVEAHAAIVPEECYAEAYLEVQQYAEEGLGLVTVISEMPASEAFGYVLMVTGSLWPDLFPWAVVQPDPEAEPSVRHLADAPSMSRWCGRRWRRRPRGGVAANPGRALRRGR